MNQSKKPCVFPIERKLAAIELQLKETIPPKEETIFEFLDAFAKHYKEEFKYDGLVSWEEMLRLFVEFKGSGETPEQWFEQQELS